MRSCPRHAIVGLLLTLCLAWFVPGLQAETPPTSASSGAVVEAIADGAAQSTAVQAPAGSGGVRSWVRSKVGSIKPGEMLQQLNPRTLWQTYRTNLSEGRYYATDLSVHDSWQAALKQSVMPTDLGANVKAAFLTKIHPLRFAGNLFDPLTMELTREVVSGQGLDARKLLTSFHPAVIASTMIGGAAGDIAGAVLQSTLAKMGPVGAVAGFFARPMIGYGAQMFGMNVGQGIAKGCSVGAAMAQSLRTIRPGRDVGQLMGSVVGCTLGQVFIPVPLVGGIIGGAVGGIAGGIIGGLLARVPPFSKLEQAALRGLNRWADSLEGHRAGKPAAAAPAAPTAASAPAGSPATAATGARAPAPGRSTPAARTGAGVDGDEPSMEDLPVAGP